MQPKLLWYVIRLADEDAINGSLKTKFISVKLIIIGILSISFLSFADL